MIERDAASTNAHTALEAETAGTPTCTPRDTSNNADCLPSETSSPQQRWSARHALAVYRAETDRLRVLIDFLSRPIHAPGGIEPDPDILAAYNLAVEGALNTLRRSARSI